MKARSPGAVIATLFVFGTACGLPALGQMPVIHYPRVVGASPRRSVVFRIPATGLTPLLFSSADLPAALQLDAKTGIVTGQMVKEGGTTAHITVQSPAGRAEAALTFVCGASALARTPPMGWDSFNIYADTVSDRAIRQAADRLIQTGLAAHGYQTIIIDDTWEGARDKKTGRMRANKRFPDMAALAAYVHSKGLKLGLSSSATQHTCAGYTGSLGHETEDAQTFANWALIICAMTGAR